MSAGGELPRQLLEGSTSGAKAELGAGNCGSYPTPFTCKTEICPRRRPLVKVAFRGAHEVHLKVPESEPPWKNILDKINNPGVGNGDFYSNPSIWVPSFNPAATSIRCTLVTRSISPRPTLLKMTLPSFSQGAFVSSPRIGLAGSWRASSPPSLSV